MLDEHDLKVRMLNRLRRDNRISGKSVIANEFRIGETGVRADLAVLGRHFLGIEVKSPKDSLRRLASQTQTYLRTFDITILLIAERHLSSLPQTLKDVEIWTADKSGFLTKVGQAPRTVTRKNAELRTILNTRQLRILERAEAASSEASARRIFEEGFRRSYQKNSDRFWADVAGRRIERADLLTLSNYRELRSHAKKKLEARMSAFRSWGSD